MSLFAASLNSGSNGNCYFIGNTHEAILIDAGISCRETEKRMANLSLPMNLIKAVFISHEHTDHIRGVETLSRKYNLPVYVTELTAKNGRISLRRDLHKIFSHGEVITLGNISITAFSKLHDAIDPYSFIVESNKIKIGVITDIGVACANVIHYFKQCNACFLETNYDTKMLEEGSYPYHLKKRISGGNGHLSNSEALALFIKHKPSYMSHLFLSHLSKENNNPELVHNLFTEKAGNTTVIVASRYQETNLYTINGKGTGFINIKKKAESNRHMQMSLFEEII